MPEPRSINTTTVIGPDTHIKGEMVFDSTARILGTFEGRIVAKGEVHVGEGAACKAAVEGATVLVDGLIEGDVTARERVQLNAKARVIGDIAATTLVVAEGASFTGHCRVGSEALKGERAPKPAEEVVTRSRSAGAPAPAERSNVTSRQSEIEATLAGLEARLSGLSKARASDAHITNGSDR